MILFLFFVVALALLLEKISLNLPVRNVRYHIGASKYSVEQGEKFYIVTTIENRTKHNISYLRIKERIPSCVRLCGEEGIVSEEEGEHTLFVRKYERVKRSIPVVSYLRGVHQFGKSELSFGDFLGIREISCEKEPTDKILVYPRRIESEKLDRIVNDLMGDITAKSFLHEDPLLVRGYREYTGREPLKSISFLQSAKCMQLMVKEFDHTRTPVANILFDVEFLGDFDHYFEQRETQFSLARMICESFVERGIHYRIITNMCYPEMETRGVNVVEGAGSGGFSRILDLLSIASGAAVCSSGELLSYAKEYFCEGAFLYIAQRDCPEVREELGRYFPGEEGVPYTFFGSEYEEDYRAGAEEKEGGAA